MSAKLIKEIGAYGQSVEQMISLYAARRAVPHVAFQRDNYARAIQPVSYLRGGDANHASMPVVSGDDGDVRLRHSVRGRFKLSERTFDDLLLHALPFTIARVQMLCQALGFRP